MRHALGCLALALLAAAPSPSAHADWGADLEPGVGPEMLEWGAPDLAALVAAPASARPRLVARLVSDGAADLVEALKRHRHPGLRPLFHDLLAHPDPEVVHRALFALEMQDDATALPRAWDLLAHEDARVREKAAITCVRLWGAPDAAPVAHAPQALRARLAAEPDPFVRASLDALARRLEGTLVVERVADEVRVTDAQGLTWAPYLRGMERAEEVAPGQGVRPQGRWGQHSASDLPVADRWTLPVRAFGTERPPPGRRLQPFGFRRNGGRTVHTGVDVAALSDGSGVYACADGVVRLVHTGTDTGTLIVVEHRLSATALANVLYMHGSDVVFVRAGERVRAGQLLGCVGLGYSFENGGHYAHLHLGIYPGPFSPSHNYGYKATEAGLDDWYDPFVVLPAWIAASDVAPGPPAR